MHSRSFSGNSQESEIKPAALASKKWSFSSETEKIHNHNIRAKIPYLHCEHPGKGLRLVIKAAAKEEKSSSTQLSFLTNPK
jgi:hypothetical protein